MALKVKTIASPFVEQLEWQVNDWLGSPEQEDVYVIDIKYAMTLEHYSCLIIYDTDPELYAQEAVQQTKVTAPDSPQNKVLEYLKNKAQASNLNLN